MLPPNFSELVKQTTGMTPYPYQQRIADEGYPDLLRAPTGSGKTLAAVMPWIWRRFIHDDPEVRAGTPHWLVIALPMRVLVEQTRDTIRDWIETLSDDGRLTPKQRDRLTPERLGPFTLMGGEDDDADRWRLHPEREAIFIGTIDMLLSRALHRGYGIGRFSWPIDFGLFNTDCHWIFDEVQLLGPALTTGRQLDGLRRKLGTAAPCTTTWMSATVDDSWLQTVDNPRIDTVIEPSATELTESLAHVAGAHKEITEIPVSAKYNHDIAAALAAHHRPGTRTIAVINTVERARDIHDRLAPLTEARVVLLHSRFRPLDRAARLAEALAEPDPDGPGVIVCSTQVIEAGVDTSADLLFTEAAPWTSVTQRAGRCNRYGTVSDARMLWAAPPNHRPYEDADIIAAIARLRDLEGARATPTTMREGPDVARQPHATLRRRDLHGLFDTTPDLSGTDIDVAAFIREGRDLDVQVAWRDFPESGPEAATPAPGRDERCPVPIHELNDSIRKKTMQAWRFDYLADAWVRVADSPVRRLRPGDTVLVRCNGGGYTAESGWTPASRTRVDPIAYPASIATQDRSIHDDQATMTGHWQSLIDHLDEVKRETAELLERWQLPGLGDEMQIAAVTAAALHDVGKAHEVFQASLQRSAGPDGLSGVIVEQPWAKSGNTNRLNHARRGFRHELASALVVADRFLPDMSEHDLMVYLIGAHHGRVRLGIRSLPSESSNEVRTILGIEDGESFPEVLTPEGVIPASTLDLSIAQLGGGGRRSWSARALALRDRQDVGPFRMALLEAVVRLSDWRASGAIKVSDGN